MSGLPVARSVHADDHRHGAGWSERSELRRQLRAGGAPALGGPSGSGADLLCRPAGRPAGQRHRRPGRLLSRHGGDPRGAGPDRLFVKAVGSAANPTSLRLYAGEVARSAALPDHPMLVKPVASATLSVGAETYAVAAFPAVDAVPPAHPWTRPVAGRVSTALRQLSDHLAEAYPRAVAVGGPALPDSTHLVDFFGSWRVVVADRTDPWTSDPWVRAQATALTQADALVQRRLVGKHPAHADLRADNILVSPTGVWFVDWAAALTAARWVDPAILFCDLVVSAADVADGWQHRCAERLLAFARRKGPTPDRWRKLSGHEARW